MISNLSSPLEQATDVCKKALEIGYRHVSIP